MKINYQIMTEEQKKDGKYYPDYAALAANAGSDEESAYIETLITWNFGFAFNMVYITKQTCGHYEIFQTPVNEFHWLNKNLELAAEYAAERKCTSCICNFRL